MIPPVIFVDVFVSARKFDRAGGDRACKATDTAGTPAFQPPEAAAPRAEAQGAAAAAIEGEVEYDLRQADIWAAGVTLFCFLFGQLPFDASNGPEPLITSIQRDPPAFPDMASAAAIGDGTLLDLLTNLLLVKDPAERGTFSNIALHQWLEHVPPVEVPDADN